MTNTADRIAFIPTKKKSVLLRLMAAGIGYTPAPATSSLDEIMDDDYMDPFWAEDGVMVTVSDAAKWDAAFQASRAAGCKTLIEWLPVGLPVLIGASAGREDAVAAHVAAVCEWWSGDQSADIPRWVA